MIPCLYYPISAFGGEYTFEDALHGSFICLSGEEVKLALVIGQNGVMEYTRPELVKVVGEEWNEVLDKIVQEVVGMKEHYIAQSLQGEFMRDVREMINKYKRSYQ